MGQDTIGVAKWREKVGLVNSLRICQTRHSRRQYRYKNGFAYIPNCVFYTCLHFLCNVWMGDLFNQQLFEPTHSTCSRKWCGFSTKFYCFIVKTDCRSGRVLQLIRLPSCTCRFRAHESSEWTSVVGRWHCALTMILNRSVPVLLLMLLRLCLVWSNTLEMRFVMLHLVRHNLAYEIS